MKNIYDMLPMLLVDGYKVGHPLQYPRDLEILVSNITARKSRVADADGFYPFGEQYFVKEYLQRQFDANFFTKPIDTVLSAYKRRIGNYLGPLKSYQHIADLHEHGYLPLLVKAVPEGQRVPFRVPFLTIQNTDKHFAWLTSTPETIMSNVLWMPGTSMTTAVGYLRRFRQFAAKTGASMEFAHYQAHDFSMRGMSGLEAACLSGAAHLAAGNLGTDTVPAIDFLEMYYGADSDVETIGLSVPATEHSVMCIGGKEGEFETILRIVTEVYPSGIVSVVWDTYDFWGSLLNYLPRLRPAVVARDGKLVIRPDSGDPVKIICGDPDSPLPHVRRGAIRVLWDIFGGSVNAAGFKELDSHIGLIYGDSITPDRHLEIMQRLAADGFASSNVVLGVGSYTYQYVTRDTYGIAMKATYAELTWCGPCEIFKDPVTDDGTKKSAVGLLCVAGGENGQPIVLEERVSWGREAEGLLRPIFHDGVVTSHETLAGIRARVAAQLAAEVVA